MPTATHPKIIQAAHQLLDEEIAQPILLATPPSPRNRRGEHLTLAGITICDPRTAPERQAYAERLYRAAPAQRRHPTEAWELLRQADYCALLMVDQDAADGMVSGLSFHYPELLRPTLQIIGTASDCWSPPGSTGHDPQPRAVFRRYQRQCRSRSRAPSRSYLTARLARDFDLTPRVALLSFSNFGSARQARTRRLQAALDIARRRAPELIIEGEMQADTALSEELLNGTYPLNQLRKEANVLIFPSLEAGHMPPSWCNAWLMPKWSGRS